MSFTSLRRWVPGAVLLAAAGTSSALTIGRAQGVALIGRPLDVSIQLGLDAPADIADLCPDVEVFYGDSRITPRRVELSTAPAGHTAASLRVRVGIPVDEAFVQVYLRVGCVSPLTRRYVLLSEQPGDLHEAALQPTPAAPLVAAPIPPLSTTAPAAAPAPALVPAPTRPAARAAAATGGASPRPASAPARRQPRPAAAKPAAPAAAAAPAPAPQGSRLKLDPIEVRPDAAAKLAAGAASQPQQAASAPEPSSEEAQRQAQRLQSLEADLKTLRDGMLKSDATLLALRTRLEKAESERYANGLVYLLAALLAGALGAAGYFWRRSRAAALAPRWWAEASQPPDEPEPPHARPSAEPELRLIEEPARAGAAGVPDAATPSLPAQSAVAGEDTQANAKLAPYSTSMGLVMPLTRGFSTTDSEGLRVSDPLPLTADELGDIQQEVDFFVSLGEHDRAIELLRQHIEAHPQASAVAWLDLLDIHHQLGRQDEYEQLRRDFEWLFNAKAPAFANFHHASEGLQAHPRILERIQAAWPRREVLGIIDDTIFRRPGGDGEEPLDLQSYRDLLLLHTVATELTQALPEPEQAVLPPITAMPPLASVPAETTAAHDAQAIDIDLDALDALHAINAPERLEGVPPAPAEVKISNLMEFDASFERDVKLPPRRPTEG